jgi:hypothetical protein
MWNKDICVNNRKDFSHGSLSSDFQVLGIAIFPERFSFLYNNRIPWEQALGQNYGPVSTSVRDKDDSCGWNGLSQNRLERFPDVGFLVMGANQYRHVDGQQELLDVYCKQIHYGGNNEEERDGHVPKQETSCHQYDKCSKIGFVLSACQVYVPYSK